ncbi:MAG: MFS transporter [Desulfuromonas thiophila]|jgi:MFS family permease|nr:MFS transporter [Desulfuromonas thiophila]MDY0398606.1 MFS transporter [Desulfuromonas thiophila]
MATNLLNRFGQRLVAFVAGEDGSERACADIPEQACHEQRRNFACNLANGAASKLAEQLAGPNLVLVWLLQLIGSPLWMLGFLMPIKQTAVLLPQLAVAGQIRRLARRKWLWVGGALVQALCLLLMLPVAHGLSPAVAGGVILLLLALFSMASGSASVAFQDVLGKTIAKGRRGRLLSLRALVGGLLTLAAGALLSLLRQTDDSLALVQGLLLAAAGLWLVSAVCFALIREDAGATEGARNPLAEVRHGLTLVRRSSGFRRFLQLRALLLCVELAPPFYFMHLHSLGLVDGSTVGLLVAAVGLAQLISSPFWGRLADETSRKVMQHSALLATAAALLALLLTALPVAGLQKALCLLAFVLIGLAEAGVRLGRKTYLVDAIPRQERASCAALSNSLVGLLALLLGGLGFIAQSAGALSLILLLGAVSGAAALLCQRLPEADALLAALQAQD